MSSTDQDTFQRLRDSLAGLYTVDAAVGEGGMAVVYKAHDVRHDRSVALKVLRPEIAASLGGERFQREIRIAAQLAHPHILPVLESGESAGLLYYAMPFVDGESLRDRLARESRLPLGDALRIIRETGQALAYAHAQGIVHRDLKPENIMLSAGIAVVTDFGIARAVSAAGAEALTRTGIAVGTPAYMSPEQALGDATLDGRSDVYSLACVLYEMLAGETPFRANTPLALLAKHTSDPVPRLRATRPEVPATVDWAIGRALAKVPDERFATMNEFLAALDADVVPAGARARGFLRRSRPMAVTAVVVAAVAAGVWGARNLRPVSNSAAGVPVVAVLPFQHIGPKEDEYFAAGMADEVSSRVAAIGGISVISRASALQFDIKSLVAVEKELKAGFALTGSVRIDRAAGGGGKVIVTPRLVGVSDGRNIWQDQFEDSITPGAIFRLQGTIAQQVAEALNVTLRTETLNALRAAPTQNLEAYNYYLRGSRHASYFLVPTEQLKAIEMFEKAVALDPSFGLAQARLSQLQALFYAIFDRTPSRLRRAEAAYERASALIPNLAQTHLARGFLASLGQWDFPAALTAFEAAQEAEPSSSELFWAIGNVQRFQGNFASALTSFTEAARLDPRSPVYAFEIAGALFALRRYDEVQPYLERLQVLAPGFPPGNIGFAQALVYAGKADSARQQMLAVAQDPAALASLVPMLIDDAIYRPLLDFVLPPVYDVAIERLQLAGSYLDSADYYFAKGELFRRRKQPARTRVYFDSLQRVILRRRVPTTRATAALVLYQYLDLSMAFAALDQPDRARVYADSAMRTPWDKFRGAYARLELARLYVRLDRKDDAIRILEELAPGPSPASPQFLSVDPAFAPLRSDPRFSALSLN